MPRYGVPILTAAIMAVVPALCVADVCDWGVQVEGLDRFSGSFIWNSIESIQEYGRQWQNDTELALGYGCEHGPRGATRNICFPNQTAEAVGKWVIHSAIAPRIPSPKVPYPPVIFCDGSSNATCRVYAVCIKGCPPPALSKGQSMWPAGARYATQWKIVDDTAPARVVNVSAGCCKPAQCSSQCRAGNKGDRCWHYHTLFLGCNPLLRPVWSSCCDSSFTAGERHRNCTCQLNV